MSNPANYTVGWICAITTEYVAAQAFLDERHDGPEYVSTHDNNHYTLGKIGKHNVVIAVLPDGEYGISSAAGVAKDMLHSFFNVRIGLMVGIGGGAPSRKHAIRLGDIIVSTSRDGRGALFQYDFGKAIQGQDFQETALLNRPPTVLRTAISGLKAQYEAEGHRLGAVIDEILDKKPRLRKKYKRPDPRTDKLYQSTVTHPPDDESTCAAVCGDDPSTIIWRPERTDDEDNPAIHYGRIASANTLMKDALVRDTLAATRGVLCFEMEAAGLVNHFPCLVVRGICDYSDTHKNKEWQGYAAMAAAAYTKDLLCQIPPNKVEAEEKIGKRLDGVIASVSHIGEVITNIQSTTTEVNSKVQDVHTVLSDARLAREVAADASFDSRAEQHRPSCLPNTRLELLQEISAWAKDPSSAAIFWLNGMAGTGKSTVSRTLALSFASQNHLGGSFFFKRGEADRGNMSKFFSTIAADLGRRQPATARHIKSAIDTDPAILTRAMHEQFDKLILGPISTISQDSQTEPIVLIVDAVDECEREEDVKLMIRLLSRITTLQPVQLKVFLTSRPDLPIRLGFNEIEGKYRGLILHEIPESIVERDIRAFLEHELARIRCEHNALVEVDRQLARDWPGPSNVETLVKMACPLFIFAATVCLFIADRRIGSPGRQLKKVLLPRAGGRLSQLAKTYMPVLDNQIAELSADERQEVIDAFRNIVGSVVILASPLSTAALARILNVARDDVEDRLYTLHSVLSVPSSGKAPVRLLHLSFRDFLLDPSQREGNAFWVDEKKTHQAMAAHCLRVMECLREDICDIKFPGTARSDIEQGKVEACLPSEVQYACTYWVYHLQGAEVCDDDWDQVYRFIKRHFLHWLESLSLIGRARESIHIIEGLQSLCNGRVDKQLSEFLDDAIRFIRTNMSGIDATPLQLYFSFLAFAPLMSKVKVTFEGYVRRRMSRLPQVERYWGQCIQSLEHSDEVYSVAFSPDGALVASGSRDTTVRLWRLNASENIQTLKGHSHEVHSVAFSPDGTLLASGSWDNTIRLWRVKTGDCIQTLKEHGGAVYSVAFSPDGTLLASGSHDTTVRLWRVKTRDCIQTLEIHSDSVRSVAFSPDGTLLASGSWDNTIQLWHVEMENCIQILGDHSNPVESVAFSPDGTLVASGSVASGPPYNTIRLWRVKTGDCIQSLEHSDEVHSVAFSRDGKLLASASSDNMIRLWRVKTGDCIQTLKEHGGAVYSVAFSRDGKLLASCSLEKTIRLWRVNVSENIQTLTGHCDRVKSVDFSPDMALLASGSGVLDTTIRLWRVETGVCVRTLKGHGNTVESVAFSPDGTLLASGSYDRTIRLWRVEIGTCIRTLVGHSNSVRSVAFSPDGTLLASGSWDNTIRLWRVKTGDCIQSLEHSEAVYSVVFSADGTLVVSGFEGTTIGLWRVNTDECIQKLDASVTISSMSFNDGSTRLLTDHDTIVLQQDTPTSTSGSLNSFSSYVPGYSVSTDRCWVTWNGEKWFWLPVDYRDAVWVISGSTVALGCPSGRVTMMEFRDEWC